MEQKIKPTQTSIAEIAEKTQHFRTAMTEIPTLPEEQTQEVLRDIKFVGVVFDDKQYKDGESKINKYLRDGYTVIKDFQTNSGIVITLGKYVKRAVN